MHCLKCGRKIPDNDSFCDTCLEDMAKYPIQPGTVVKLPTRPATAVSKKRNIRRRRTIKPEEQIAVLRRRCRWLTFFLIIFILATLAAGAGLLFQFGLLEGLSIHGLKVG